MEARLLQELELEAVGICLMCLWGLLNHGAISQTYILIFKKKNNARDYFSQFLKVESGHHLHFYTDYFGR